MSGIPRSQSCCFSSPKFPREPVLPPSPPRPSPLFPFDPRISLSPSLLSVPRPSFSGLWNTCLQVHPAYPCPICCRYHRLVGRGGLNPRPQPLPTKFIGRSPEVPADHSRETADRGVLWAGACSARPSPPPWPHSFLRKEVGTDLSLLFTSTLPKLLIHKTFWHALNKNGFVYI